MKVIQNFIIVIIHLNSYFVYCDKDHDCFNNIARYHTWDYQFCHVYYISLKFFIHINQNFINHNIPLWPNQLLINHLNCMKFMWNHSILISYYILQYDYNQTVINKAVLKLKIYKNIDEMTSYNDHLLWLYFYILLYCIYSFIISYW